MNADREPVRLFSGGGSATRRALPHGGLRHRAGWLVSGLRHEAGCSIRLVLLRRWGSVAVVGPPAPAMTGRHETCVAVADEEAWRRSRREGCGGVEGAEARMLQRL